MVMTLQEIANFWNGFIINDQEPDMSKLNQLIVDSGCINDCHEEWGICHNDAGKVVLDDDLIAYVDMF